MGGSGSVHKQCDGFGTEGLSEEISQSDGQIDPPIGTEVPPQKREHIVLRDLDDDLLQQPSRFQAPQRTEENDPGGQERISQIGRSAAEEPPQTKVIVDEVTLGAREKAFTGRFRSDILDQ